MAIAADDRDQWIALLRSDIERFNQERKLLGRTRISLRDADLSGLDLTAADLAPADLTAANLAGSRVPSLTHCRLESSKLDRIVGPDSDKARLLALLWSDVGEFNRRRQPIEVFEMADLSDADLKDADLQRAQIFNSNLSGANLSRCNLDEANLQKSIAVAALFAGNQIEAVDFSCADLSRADFAGAQLSHARLNGALLDDANFRGARLISGGIAQARGQRVNFEDALLRTVNVNALVAPGARFGRSTLIRIDFAGGDLRGADFRGATFEDVSFDDIDLTDVDFRGTDTSHINFGNVPNRGKARF